MKSSLLCILLSLVPAAGQTAGPMDTHVTVHVVAHDAKLIGSHVGGARVLIRDADSGRLLASGVQQGETGDTKAIMKEPRLRGLSVYSTPGAGAFETTLHLNRPTRVRISAEGPLGNAQATVKAETTLVLLPGHDVRGDGIVLELHGFIIEPLDPLEFKPGVETPLRVKATMACGCPIEPGGLWDADKIEITARILRGDETIQTIRLSYAGVTSTFAGSVPSLARGKYTLEITAADPASANFALYRSRFRIR